MSNAPAEPLLLESRATLRRPGRVLLGWMSEDEGALALAGRDMAGSKSEEFRAKVQQAREGVTLREPYSNSEDVVDYSQPQLAEIEERLRDQTDTAVFWTEGWSVGAVDLRRICSLQQSVASQQAADRVTGVIEGDLISIAEVTLPRSSTSELHAQFDPVRNAWIVSATNPNLRIVGGFSSPPQEGVAGLGFAISITASFLQVAIHHGRPVLRDGYHRAFGLLQRGVTHAPALVRDFGVGDLGLGAGLFPTDIYLSPRPPLLADFLDDALSASVEVPIVQKMIVVQGLELTPLA